MLRVQLLINGLQGAPYYASHYFGGNTVAEAQAASDAAAELWNDMNSVQSIPLTWQTDPEVPVVDIATGQTTQVWVVTPDSGAGSGSGDPVPFASQGLIRWRTQQFVAGRELRGRTFLPGIPESAAVAGKVAAAAQSTINTSIGIFLSSSAAAGDAMVYSPTHRVAHRITSASVWDQFAILRSRRD